MNLAVTTRISAGFTSVVIFLIIIGLTGVYQIGKISDNLSLIVDEMEPMSRLAGDLRSTILETHQFVTSLSRSEEKEELTSLSELVSERGTLFSSHFTKLKQKSTDYSSLKKSMSNIDSQSSNYYATADKIISYQAKYLSMKNTVEDNQMDLEDHADDLDTALLDLIDSSNTRALKSTAESISSLASDAVISSVDGLEIEKMQSLEIKIREMEAIVTTLKERLSNAQNQARTNSDKSQVEEIVSGFDKYLNALTGDSSLLSLYRIQLEAKLAAKSTLEESKLQEKEILAETDILVNNIGRLAADTKQTAETSVSNTYIVIMALSVISLIIAAGIAFWVVQSIRVPLKRVTTILKVISSGDLSQKIEVDSNDEFGQLSELVNELVDSLKTIIQNIKDNTEQLRHAADQTSTVTREANENITQQRLQTNHILESMEQMTAAVDEVATSAHSTSDEVEKAHSETESGLDIVTSNIHSITSLASEIDKASVVINQLNEYSVNIGNILDVIRGIADQTNLLALNAAIEAARAGEQGRGFAVVADEVRTLASRTQESTSEIQDMIERLQTGATEAVEVMQGSRNSASSSVDDIEKAGELLKTITLAISSINDMSTDIATAAEQQSSVTDEVFSNVNTISDLADKTATGAESTKASSEKVAQLSDELIASVNHFKVN